MNTHDVSHFLFVQAWISRLNEICQNFEDHTEGSKQGERDQEPNIAIYYNKQKSSLTWVGSRSPLSSVQGTFQRTCKLGLQRGRVRDRACKLLVVLAHKLTITGICNATRHRPASLSLESCGSETPR